MKQNQIKSWIKMKKRKNNWRNRNRLWKRHNRKTKELLIFLQKYCFYFKNAKDQVIIAFSKLRCFVSFIILFFFLSFSGDVSNVNETFNYVVRNLCFIIDIEQQEFSVYFCWATPPTIKLLKKSNQNVWIAQQL